MKITEKAYEFAEKAHKGQKQATGKPYIEHPRLVAKLLKKWKQDDEVISAALLHDVVEDCNVPLSKIRKFFGKKVVSLVDAMSIVMKNGKKDIPATYRKFVRYAKKEPSLVLIKTADLISNLPNIKVPSHREFVVKKSYPRIMMFWIPLLKEVGLREEALMIEKAHQKYTKKRIKSVLKKYVTKKELTEIKRQIIKTNPVWGI